MKEKDAHRTNLPLVRIAGLFEKKSSRGNRYFIGRMNAARLLMFSNTEKQGESDPDWYLFVQEREDTGARGGNQKAP